MSSTRTDSSSFAEAKFARATRHEPAGYAVAIGVATFFVAISIWISLKRLFWFDELMTFQIVAIPNASTFWAALHRGFDGMPPAYYLLERFLLVHIHPAELALRLPSVIAAGVGSLVVFDCGRRLTNALFGLFGMAVVLSSFVAYYSCEARSYSLYFLCSALALWVWCHTRGRLGAFLFGLCFFAGIMMHFYFFICLTPYVLYECLHWRPGRWPTARLMSGVIGTGCAMLVVYPELTAQRVFNKTFWTEPTLAGLVHVYDTSFPFGVAIVLFAAGWLALGRFRLLPSRSDVISRHELVGWLSLAIPIAGYLVAKLVTHAFVDRYFICFVPGLAMAVACLCYRNFGPWSMSGAGVLLIVLTMGMGDLAKFAVHPEALDYVRLNLDYEQVRTKDFLANEGSIEADGKRSILLCEALLFSQVRHYSERPSQYHYLYNPHTNAERIFNQGLLAALNDYVPQNLWTLRDLERNAADSAVVDLPPEDLATLQADGFQVHLAKKFGKGLRHAIEVLYLSR